MQSKVIKLSINADGGTPMYLKDSFIDSHSKDWINQFYSFHNEKKKRNSDYKLKLVCWFFFQEYMVFTGREEKGWSIKEEHSALQFYSDALTLVLPFFLFCTL